MQTTLPRKLAKRMREFKRYLKGHGGLKEEMKLFFFFFFMKEKHKFVDNNSFMKWHSEVQGEMRAAGRKCRVHKEGFICSFICLFLFSIKDLNTIYNTWKETGSEEDL